MPEPDQLRPYGRRTFLLVVAGGLSSLAWGEPVWRAVSSALRPAAELLPSEVRALVPSQGWRIYTVGSSMPRFNSRTWRLTIDGLVERPQQLRYDQLRSLPRAEQVSTFHCVTGWTVKNVHWAGVRFRDLFSTVGPRREARVVRFVSAEVPYTDSLTLEQAYLGDAMLAYEMDGRPLRREHGAPARVVIPEMYGYKNVKWVRADRADRQAGGRFLGGARLRPRRLGRPLQWPRLSIATCAASPAPSAHSTGHTRSPSSSCLCPGSRSTCHS